MTLGAAQASGFAPFTVLHGVTVLVGLAIVFAACVLGRRWRGTPVEPRAAKAVATLGLVQFLAYFWWFGQAHAWNPRVVLPLQLCDLATPLACIALARADRRSTTLVYFWGLALSTQGFITPTLRSGLSSPGFWFFWTSHVLIFGTAVYVVVVRNFRPGARDWLVAVGAGVAYLALAMTVNLALDANYGYVGRSLANTPTIVDYLGPWPWRVGVMAIIVVIGMALAWLPWVALGDKRTS